MKPYIREYMRPIHNMWFSSKEPDQEWPKAVAAICARLEVLDDKAGRTMLRDLISRLSLSAPDKDMKKRNDLFWAWWQQHPITTMDDVSALRSFYGSRQSPDRALQQPGSGNPDEGVAHPLCQFEAGAEPVEDGSRLSPEEMLLAMKRDASSASLTSSNASGPQYHPPVLPAENYLQQAQHTLQQRLAGAEAEQRRHAGTLQDLHAKRQKIQEEQAELSREQARITAEQHEAGMQSRDLQASYRDLLVQDSALVQQSADWERKQQHISAQGSQLDAEYQQAISKLQRLGRLMHDTP